MWRGYTPPYRWAEQLRCLFPPSRWGMLTYYCPEWDNYMRVAITMGMVRLHYHGLEELPEWVSDHSVDVGPHNVWVGNYPFSYGHKGWDGRVRPSFATMRLLKKEVKRLRRQHEENK